MVENKEKTVVEQREVSSEELVPRQFALLVTKYKLLAHNGHLQLVIEVDDQECIEVVIEAVFAIVDHECVGDPNHGVIPEDRVLQVEVGADYQCYLQMQE